MAAPTPASYHAPSPIPHYRPMSPSPARFHTTSPLMFEHFGSAGWGSEDISSPSPALSSPSPRLQTPTSNVAMPFFLKMYENATPEEIFTAGSITERNANIVPDERLIMAQQYFQMAADRGHPGAMHRLSCYLELGAAGPRDEEGSLFYLKQAAKNGDVESMVSLGIKYGKGTIVPLSERKSAKWYLRAAENGDEFATRILLDAPWSWSQGTVRNSEKLFARCITDATSGKTKAMIRIGRMFLEANGVPFTPDEYLKWFHMAAEAKSTEAMLELSHIHAMGKGVEQSCEKSIYWIQRAAQTGDTLAMKKMGEIYKEGKGVPQSDSEAAKWYLLAAEKGDALAMVIFGLMQKKGIGVELNEEAAYKWFKRADEKADTTDRIFIEDFLQRNLHRS